jgi:hypothetical protein
VGVGSNLILLVIWTGKLLFLRGGLDGWGRRC